jgi:hypothetical protein
MFSEKALKAQEPLITGYVDKLISRLHEQAEKPQTATVDLVRWYNYTTFDVSSLVTSELLHKTLGSFLTISADYFKIGPWGPCIRRLIWVPGIQCSPCEHSPETVVVIADESSLGLQTCSSLSRTRPSTGWRDLSHTRSSSGCVSYSLKVSRIAEQKNLLSQAREQESE